MRIYTCNYINSSSSEATAAFILFLSGCFFKKTFQSPARLIPKLIAIAKRNLTEEDRVKERSRSQLLLIYLFTYSFEQ